MPYAREGNDPAIYYETEGNGTPIIFIPPPGMGHLTFRYQKYLKENCQVITFDVRGDCRSEKSKASFDVHTLAHDVKTILDHNDIDKAVVCGYSNGGCIAQEFALTFPDRTAGIILIGGYYDTSNFWLRKEYQLGIWVAKRHWIKLLAAGLAKNHFKDNQAAKEMMDEIVDTDPDMLAKQYQAGLVYNSLDKLHLLEVPLLLIYGARDLYVHAYQKKYRELVKDVEVVYVQKSKHQVPTRFYHECNAIIQEWVTRKGIKV
ncbi:alpha/beta hydrolase [Gracilibacillus sp. YIM 98692]|uniref:alpha/beta fold hydrolase n=1 Tax=Gracilibacillus sp. YIM 98692 TaxID=2663532 RepID=UPI0013D85D73|nr:alpha/beta hydrolase [Gracilibacillus sp. YIM 98692]